MNEYAIEEALAMGKKHPLFQAITFVAAARDDDEYRNLHAIKVEKNELVYTLVATNGKRLHTAEFDPGMFEGDFDELMTGCYEVIAINAKTIVIARLPEDKQNFPKWRSLLPTAEKYREVNISSKTISRLGILSGCLLATDYATQACGFGCGLKKDDQANIEFSYIGGQWDPFMIKHELGRALVMPMRLDSHDEDASEDEEHDESTMTPEFESLKEEIEALKEEPEPAEA